MYVVIYNMDVRIKEKKIRKIQ